MEEHRSRVIFWFEIIWLFRSSFDLLDNIIDRSHHEHSSREHRSRDSRRERSRDRNRERTRNSERARNSNYRQDRDRDRRRDRERARRFDDGLIAPVVKEEKENPEAKKDLNNAALEALEIAKKISSSGIIKLNNWWLVQKPRVSRFSNSIITRKIYFPAHNPDIDYVSIFNGPYKSEIEGDTFATLTVGGVAVYI